MYYPMKFIFFVLTICLLLSFKLSAQDRKTVRLIHKVEKKLKKSGSYFDKWKQSGKIILDSVYVNRSNKVIELYYNKALSYIPVRENIIREAKKSLKKQLGWWLRKYRLEIYARQKNINAFVPNIYRKNLPLDSSRFKTIAGHKNPVVSRFYRLKPDKGLLNNNLAVWHSHGKYYEAKLDRWEWQRARMHSTVEDVFPMSFILDYLEPMLENAGATVFIPRERDTNNEEYIIDIDFSNSNFSMILQNIDTSKSIINTGFKWKDTLFNNENPFQMGKSLTLVPEKNKTGSIRIYPGIDKTGKYAVYISYGKSGNTKVKYIIKYSGGKKEFLVDQTQGQNTWIYLGKFFFKKSKSKTENYIEICGDKKFNVDAIKIGGGMGNIARRPAKEIIPQKWSLKGQKQAFQNDKKQKVSPDAFTWKTSGLPRYLEAARYYLQYCGMPDSLVYSLSQGKSDYNDDYQSRGEWVNFLMGKPNGPTGHSDVEGLGIPIDLALAFHTDAGVTPGDSIIGTLAIYSSDTPDTVFPSGQSKMVNRDLVDIIQTQIVNDIRLLDNPKWTRRGIWNKPYSEAWRANTPMMLLELMSHQNLADISYGLDHRFKFDVARAIYKGMLKFLAYQNHKDYVVQPLPVNNFSINIIKDKKIKLSWHPVSDPLEPTAVPQGYIVYRRPEDSGFDQGQFVKHNYIEMELPDYNTIYSFKITAVNSGGESFPSEILSVGITKENAPVALIVNSFDRVSGPAIIDKPGFSGVAYWQDMGVPYQREIALTGMPYEFDRDIAWADDDNPGWGASFADWEGKIFAGNDFDYPFVHGKAIMNAGYSFTSTSDESFIKKNYNINPYKFIDIIFGEQRTVKTLNKTAFTVFTPEMMRKIKETTDNKGNIFISGAYIGTDFAENNDSVASKFAEGVLHYKWRTNFASKTGDVFSTDYTKKYFSGKYHFNTQINSDIYQVEAPDGIEPAGKNAVSAFRYKDTAISAGVIFNGKYKVVALGFPFETVTGRNERAQLMKQITEFFDEKVYTRVKSF